MNNISLVWQDMSEPQWGRFVEPFVQLVLEYLQHKAWELSIVFCKDTFIHELNKKYRHIDHATDVLSFAQGDEFYDDEGNRRFNAGDIVISLDMLKVNAETFNVPVDEELKRLLIHGILHLSGMDHSDNSPQQEMLQLQEKILSVYSGSTAVYQG